MQWWSAMLLFNGGVPMRQSMEQFNGGLFLFTFPALALHLQP
jgi:hypothetical protein